MNTGNFKNMKEYRLFIDEAAFLDWNTLFHIGVATYINEEKKA